MNIHTVKATTIPDAWFQLIAGLVHGDVPHEVYEIDKGSYVGQQRLEYNHVTVQIDHPGSRPLIPDIPEGLAIPAPVESMQYIEDYFTNYLMDPHVLKNETYRYSTWFEPGVRRVIEQLKGAPGNNQAAISIGGWAPTGLAHGAKIGVIKVNGKESESCLDTDNDIDPGTGQRDPACLRVVDFRLDQSGTLHMIVYFRSWDLWGGFPANLGGLQLAKEYVAHEIGAHDGKIIASSKGLHLYSHAIDVAATRLGMDEVGSMDDLLQWMEKNG